MLKLITFDLDNTLWPVREVIERAESASSQHLQSRFPELAQQLTVSALHETRDRLVKDQSDYWKNLTRLRIDTLTRALLEGGISQAEATQAAQDGFDVFYEERNRVSYFPGAIALLEKLRDTYILGAMSNGNSNLERVGLSHLFDFHHSAESIGEAKPAPAFFAAALNSAAVTADQALHLGDHPYEDVEGARQAGMTAVWANIVKQDWPEALSPPDWQIRHLNEFTQLPPLLHE